VTTALGLQRRLAWSALRSLREGRPERRELLAQAAALGTDTVPLVVAGMACFGAVVVTIAWTQARRYTGNIAAVGPIYLQLIIREFVPLLVSVLAGSRQAAAIAAHLGAMASAEQVEALELCGADPALELVVPRILASTLVMPALMLVGAAVAVLAAVGTIGGVYGADGWAFADGRYLDRVDVACFLVKALACGAYVPVAACARGLQATSGADAVGEAVTGAVVDACFGCLAIDFLVALSFLPWTT
jgi:phospholipid/cholesterol/gamma-HCH transport system permease protein